MRLPHPLQCHKRVTGVGVSEEGPGPSVLSIPPPVKLLQGVGQLQGQGVFNGLDLQWPCAGEKAAVAARGVLAEPPLQPA
jgi:hypothetical protein